MEQKNKKPMVGFKQAFLSGCKGIFTFSGRARRSEYWWWVFAISLANVIYFGILFSIAQLGGKNDLHGLASVVQSLESGIRTFIVNEVILNFILEGIILLPFYLPPLLLLSSQVRRFHDTNKSAIIPILTNTVYILSISVFLISARISTLYDDMLIKILLILDFCIFIGSCYIFVVSCKDSQPQTNKYGKSPKYGE